MASTGKIKSSEAASSKVHPLQDDSIIQQLSEIFRSQPVSISANDLIEKFNRLRNLPPKWSGRKLKVYLTQQGLLQYQRSKPAGYLLNLGGLEDFKRNPIPQKSNIKKPKKAEKKKLPQGTANSTANSTANATIKVTAKTTAKGTIKGKAKDSSKSRRDSSIEVKEIVKANSNAKKGTNIHSANESVDTILDSIPKYANYLMERMPKQAQSVFQLGAAQISSLSLKKLDKNIEYLTAAKIFYDTSYPNEAEIVAALDKKIRFMSEISEKKHNVSVEQSFRKIFGDLYNSGKFASIITNWGKKYGIDECSYQIWKKMGRKAKKIPLSDYALRKMIATTLLEKYPEKSA